MPLEIQAAKGAALLYSGDFWGRAQNTEVPGGGGTHLWKALCLDRSEKKNLQNPKKLGQKEGGGGPLVSSPGKNLKRRGETPREGMRILIEIKTLADWGGRYDVLYAGGGSRGIGAEARFGDPWPGEKPFLKKKLFPLPLGPEQGPPKSGPESPEVCRILGIQPHGWGKGVGGVLLSPVWSTHRN